MALPAVQVVVPSSVASGVSPATYRILVPYVLAGTITAVTKVPIYVERNVTNNLYQANITGFFASNLSTSNAGTITIDILKRAQNAAAASDTSIFATLGVLGNNSEAVGHAIGTSGITARTGSTNPVLSATASVLALAPGDALVLTTTAASTQGTDLCCELEITYQLGDAASASQGNY